MSERWKYQIKSGGFWGLFMTLFMTFFEHKEATFAEQFTHPKFYFRAVIYLVMGIFVLGYFNWKAKVKNDAKK